MFSLNESGQQVAPVPKVSSPRTSPITYAEWAAFGIFLLLLAALWYFIRFGWPGTHDQQTTSSMHPLPEEVVSALLAPGRSPQPMPSAVKSDLLKSKPARNTTSETSSSSLPPEVIKYLTASK